MAELAAFWPQVLGISVSHLASVSEAVEIGEAARQAVPGCSVFAGGHRLSFAAGGVLGHDLRSRGSRRRHHRPAGSYGPYPAESHCEPFVVPQLLNVRHGVVVVENLRLEEAARNHVHEFLLVISHAKLRGATGAWVAPLAIV